MRPTPEPIADFMDWFFSVSLLWPAADTASHFASSDSAWLVYLAVGAVVDQDLAAC